MNATLNLLTSEGAVSCRFEGGLTAEQYANLYNAVRNSETKAELVTNLRRFADKWELTVMVDGVEYCHAVFGEQPRDGGAEWLRNCPGHIFLSYDGTANRDHHIIRYERELRAVTFHLATPNQNGKLDGSG